MGKRYSPLDENDKIKDLAVVVAAALAQVFPNGGPIELTLGVSSPIFYQGIEEEMINELSKLTAGFSYGSHQYVVLLGWVGWVLFRRVFDLKCVLSSDFLMSTHAYVLG
ncbi:MAG: hypothetical protein HLUCCA11_22185 [Phormidesmis priestleyi Ana]|uniref:Uncharacterized protein n=1 Tax=Phormidesmis priestleyi Ana TaxID=1666911 RepID=A0A0P7ZHF5_9CYAN|nr:MAG: hypothetical protein HLUCCA11_22185 [Phormidesmis priestleyi Ana]